jgi:hypothetical protein
MQATAEKVVSGQAEIVGGSKAKEASLLTRVGMRFGVDRELVYRTLTDTAFRQRPDRKTGEIRKPTTEEMVALLTIADQYNLNPFTRELYAFLDPKSGAIVPIVSVDGWVRIINEHPIFARMEFAYSEDRVELKNGKWAHEWIECSIYRRDRDAPMVVREYFEEVFRGDKDYETPWDTHPKRFHRHKALSQCGRYAFGFAGFHDPDEGERIIEGEAMRMADVPPAIADINKRAQQRQAGAPAIEHNPGEQVPAATVVGDEPAKVVADQEKPAAAAKAAKGTAKDASLSYAEVRDRIEKAKDCDTLDMAEGFIDGLPPQFHAELHEIAKSRREKLF